MRRSLASVGKMSINWLVWLIALGVALDDRGEEAKTDQHETASLTGLPLRCLGLSLVCPPLPANVSRAKFPDRPLRMSSARLAICASQEPAKLIGNRICREPRSQVDLHEPIQMRSVPDSSQHHPLQSRPVFSAPGRTEWTGAFCLRSR
jgi:hypothetical protein